MSSVRVAERGDASQSTRTGEASGVCIGIATRGRPQQVAAVIEHIGCQTLRPDSIIVSCTGPEDVGRGADAAGVTTIFGPPGLARQRNAILRAMPHDTRTLVFFDDDFIAHPAWIAEVVSAFDSDPSLACITGQVVADGILGPGLSIEQALESLEGCDPADHDWVLEGYSPYGCNMAYRRAAIDGLWFDERLVLYGWLEDRDFGACVARGRGRLVKLGSALGVHLGVKTGRVSGLRLGYSQVMNPAYMRGKSTMTTGEAMRQVARNVAANSWKSLNPEPYVDRRGRLAGNFIAAADILRRRLTPERAESL